MDHTARDERRTKKPATLCRPSQDKTLDACVICLCPITERAICSPCNHLAFDFLCLVSWLQEHAVCPLCKCPVSRVEYDWRGPEDFLSYTPPSRQPQSDSQSLSSSSSHGVSEATAVGSRYLRPGLYNRTRAGRGLYSSHTRNWPQTRSRTRTRTPASQHWGPATQHRDTINSLANPSSLARRRRVYELDSYSLYVGANRISEYRDFTPTSFKSTPALQSRARTFLRRELSVFSFLGGDPGSTGSDSSSTTGINTSINKREFVIEYMLGMLKTLEIKGADGGMEDLVSEILGRKTARLFLHELEAWLRSPFTRLEDWDRGVQYREVELGYGFKAR